MIIILILLLKVFSLFFILFFWIPRPTFPQWPAHSWAQIRNTLQQAAGFKDKSSGCHGTTFEKDPIFRYFHTGHQTSLYIRTYEHIMYLLYYVQEKKTHVIIMSTNHWIFQRMWCLNLQVGSDGADLLDKLTYYDPRRCRVRSVRQ